MIENQSCFIHGFLPLNLFSIMKTIMKCHIILCHTFAKMCYEMFLKAIFYHSQQREENTFIIHVKSLSLINYLTYSDLNLNCNKMLKNRQKLLATSNCNISTWHFQNLKARTGAQFNPKWKKLMSLKSSLLNF